MSVQDFDSGVRMGCALAISVISLIVSVGVLIWQVRS